MLDVQYPEIPRGRGDPVGATPVRGTLRPTRGPECRGCVGDGGDELPKFQGAGWGVLCTRRSIQAGNRLPQIKADPRFEGTVGGFEARGIDPLGRGQNRGGVTAK